MTFFFLFPIRCRLYIYVVLSINLFTKYVSNDDDVMSWHEKKIKRRDREREGENSSSNLSWEINFNFSTYIGKFFLG